jgi:DNA-binding protein HU-beta
MNKAELIETLADSADLSKSEGSRLLEGLLSTITDVLKSGDQVVLPGFGTFSVGHRAARKGRNPKTGEEIQIKAARVAKFKVGKALKEAVQED